MGLSAYDNDDDHQHDDDEFNGKLNNGRAVVVAVMELSEGRLKGGLKKGIILG